MRNAGMETGTLREVLSCEPPDGWEALWASAKIELAALEADTARWDFMEKGKLKVHPLRDVWCCYPAIHWSGEQAGSYGNTLRAAIDKAMEAANKET